MTAFPALKTGAFAQYPADRTTAFSTHIVTFVDGTEQRFAGYGSPLHIWVIKLERLDEKEINLLARFYQDQAGASGAFAFADPWDGTVYENCSFGSDNMVNELLNVNSGRTSLTIIENRT